MNHWLTAPVLIPLLGGILQAFMGYAPISLRRAYPPEADAGAGHNGIDASIRRCAPRNGKRWQLSDLCIR